MHEYAITEALLKTASEYAENNGAKRVLSLNLVIGDLSGIMDESVQFYWDMVSEDTICAGSILKFEKQSAVFRCLACQSEFPMVEELAPCPKCGSIDIRVISGDDFTLKSIEIEK